MPLSFSVYSLVIVWYVAARITGVAAAQPDPRKYRDYELACAAAAA